MEHRITLGDTTVVCDDHELETLKRVCRKFWDMELDEMASEEEYSPSLTLTFAQLNTPESNDSELCLSHWGDNGYRSNKIADEEAQQEYGVYFSVLIFLDGCQDYFRTDKEGYNEDGFLSQAYGITNKH